jgi:sialidase-1
VCRSSIEFPRHSEGDVVALRDGKLLLAWTEFYGGYGDHAAARISSLVSSDGGLTWGQKSVLQRNVGRRNVMSVSFLRLQSGPLLFFFLVKHGLSDCQVWVRRSEDEAGTWSGARRVCSRPGYHVMNNARAVQLSDGRILAPVALTSDIRAGPPSRVFCYISDDDGVTWRAGAGDAGVTGSPAQEPGVVELGDSSNLMIIRTKLGFVYTSRSADRGETWTDPAPSTIVSPASPATVARVPGKRDLLLVWNNNPNGADARWQDRTPLTSAVSSDGGVIWTGRKELESDPGYCHAYTSVTFVGDDVLLTYYVWPRESGYQPFENTSLRLRRLPLRWFTS